MAGEESDHSPENGDSAGRDQWPFTLCDSTITVQCVAVRVKKSVLPSGENVGEPSLAGPEISPGANICASVVDTVGAGTGDWPYARGAKNVRASREQVVVLSTVDPLGGKSCHLDEKKAVG